MIREPHQLGDAPIEREYREKMNHLAAVLDSYLNGEARGNDRETGFVLLVFPFGEKEGRCNYISNGADRKDIVAMMKEQIKRFEGQPDMRDAAALTKKPRDLTVARVDEHGVAYNAAGESIGITGRTGHQCSGAVGSPRTEEANEPQSVDDDTR